MNAHVPAAFLADRRTRARIEALIDRLIAALDAFDGDLDLEDGCDREFDPADMEEDDHEEDCGEDEPSLGSSHSINQDHAWQHDTFGLDLDLEFEGGTVPECA